MMTHMDNDINGVAIDFETADYRADSACAVGLVKIRKGKICDSLYTLLRPPRSHVMFTEIHGLTWNCLYNQPSFAAFFPHLLHFLEDTPCLIAHNAPFDRKVLSACCAAAGYAVPHQPFCCTLKGARRCLGLTRNGLSAVCTQLSIPLDHHHALSDAHAAACIYIHLRQHGLRDIDMYIKAMELADARTTSNKKSALRQSTAQHGGIPPFQR